MEKDKEVIPDYQLKGLVLSGGGVKGFSYFGVIKALCDLKINKELKRYGGASVGACVALFLALGYNTDELYSFITSLEYDKLKNWDFIHILTNWGLETCDRINIFIKKLIKNKLNNEEATFKDLYDYNQNELTVIVTHLNTQSAVELNHINTPNEPLWLAVRKSASYPLGAIPVKIINSDGNTDVYIDGALKDNFPIHIFPDENNIAGFLLEDYNRHFQKIEYFEDYLVALMGCIGGENLINKVKMNKNRQIINLEVSLVNVLDVGVTREDREKLFKLGYDSTFQYFTKLLNTLQNQSLEQK